MLTICPVRVFWSTFHTPSKVCLKEDVSKFFASQHVNQEICGRVHNRQQIGDAYGPLYEVIGQAFLSLMLRHVILKQIIFNF